MRNHPTIHRFALIMIISIAIGSMTPLWAAPDMPAQTSQPEPTVRELLERNVKSGQVTKQADAETAQLGIPDDSLGRGVPRDS